MQSPLGDCYPGADQVIDKASNDRQSLMATVKTLLGETNIVSAA